MPFSWRNTSNKLYLIAVHACWKYFSKSTKKSVVLLGVSPTMLLAINLFTPITYIMKFNLTLLLIFVFKIVNLLRSELKQHVKRKGWSTVLLRVPKGHRSVKCNVLCHYRGAFALYLKVPRYSCHVRLSACVSTAPTGRIYVKFGCTLITNLMHWLLFIHKILFSSTCFEHLMLETCRGE